MIEKPMEWTHHPTNWTMKTMLIIMAIRIHSSPVELAACAGQRGPRVIPNSLWRSTSSLFEVTISLLIVTIDFCCVFFGSVIVRLRPSDTTITEE